MLARAVSLQVLNRRCLVLVDNCNWTGHECDVLGVTTDLRIIDVEVKISRSDLKADAKKDKWWDRRGWGHYERVDGVRKHGPAPATARLYPPKVWKHYYAMPAEIWKPDLLECLPSVTSGVLLFREQRNSSTPLAMTVERRAVANRDATRLRAEHVVDIARLANLRMWEAYAQMEAREAEYVKHFFARWGQPK